MNEGHIVIFYFSGGNLVDWALLPTAADERDDTPISVGSEGRGDNMTTKR